VNRDQKSAVIEEVAGELKEAQAVFAVDYRGISVQQVADLRTQLYDAGARFRVVKNRLTQRAADDAGMTELKDWLEGPTALTFVSGDAALAAKAIATFRRQHEVLEFKGGTMGGVALSTEELTALSRLPARDVMHGQLVGMLASPITGLVRGLASLISGLAIQLRQIEEQGLVSGEAPAAPAEADEAPAAPAAESPDEQAETDEPPSEAPGDPVAEAEAVEPEPEAPGGDEQPEGGESAPEADEESKEG
jgi:large subunit ribosomal protein L10